MSISEEYLVLGDKNMGWAHIRVAGTCGTRPMALVGIVTLIVTIIVTTHLTNGLPQSSSIARQIVSLHVFIDVLAKAGYVNRKRLGQ